MIQNYLKVALRSIFRNKLTAFINIAGLAIAMMCCILIYLFGGPSQLETFDLKPLAPLDFRGEFQPIAHDIDLEDGQADGMSSPPR